MAPRDLNTEMEALSGMMPEDPERDELLDGARAIARPTWERSVREYVSLRSAAVVVLAALSATAALVVRQERAVSRPRQELRNDRRQSLVQILDRELRADGGVRPLPIILDTDIGDDFDDTWALVLALSSPEDFDVKLVLTAHGDTATRAKVVAKYLSALNRTDVPIGVGVGGAAGVGPLAGWAADFDMASYPGIVHQDGVAKMAEILQSSGPPVFIAAVGPQENLAALADTYPEAAARVGRVFSMMGGVDFCYDHAPGAGCLEYNVVQAIEPAQRASEVGWPMTIVPLDTCEVPLRGDPWRRFQESGDAGHPVASLVLESLRFWGGDRYPSGCPESDIIFDALALYGSVHPEVFEWDDIKLKVGSDGSVRRDDEGTEMTAAMRWSAGGLDAVQEDMVSRILNSDPAATLTKEPTAAV
jgi:inosine-uridine nucleoside N-ribohydrolase